MYPCPHCGQRAFDAGRCGRCGFYDPRYANVRVVTGQAAARPASVPASAPSAPVELDPSALQEEDGGPTLPGFESTALVEPPAPPSARLDAPTAGDEAPSDFVYSACPRCRSPQPDPPDTFCGHCGYRLKRRLRAKDDADTVTCRECGTPNPDDRAQCVNCGFPVRRGG